jgi:DNA primase
VSLSPAFLDELRARTDLPALVGRAAKLTRAGRDWRGCCPFHNEKSPSFYVYADHYHCFGCGAHGDAIRWLTEKHGLSFLDAVKELAAAAGLEVPAPTPQARAKAERAATLHDVTAEAQRWFEAQLWGDKGGAARVYLERRGVTAATARAFGLGYAPEDRTGLKRALAAHPEALLVEAGLLIQPDGEELSFDRFRGRLIFPIRDARGRPVGFGGRAFGDVKPKYLNSPDTPLFDKGRLLFNLDRAAGPARERGRLVLVEGYMDVIALAQAGIAEVVAPLGTALTEHQLALAWRLVPEPVLCFDGDAAGLKAAEKAARRALPELAPGRSVRIATLPAGQDPDDLVRSSGSAAVEAVLAAAEPLHAMLWRAVLAAAETETPEGRAGLKATLAELTATIADREVRRQYEQQFRDHFWGRFGWKRGRGSAAPAAVRPRAALLSARDREVLGLLTDLLDAPGEGCDCLELLASIPVTNARVTRLRDAIVESLAASPDLDSAGLQNNLGLGGHGQLYDWARMATARLGPRRPAGSLHLRAEALAAVDQNRAARRAVADGLAAALADGGLRAEALFAEQRALILGRRDLHETFFERAQAAAVTSASQPDQPAKADDGENG